VGNLDGIVLVMGNLCGHSHDDDNLGGKNAEDKKEYLPNPKNAELFE
jgi:hypothetical protein